MHLKNIFFSLALILLCGANALIAQVSPSYNSNAQKMTGQRLFQPEDLFRLWQIGATRWSPDGKLSAIEVLRPGRNLDRTIPTGEIRILDAAASTLRAITSPATNYIGFFNPIWSPDGRHLAFLSVDSNAFVQPWIWTVGTPPPRPLAGIDVKIGNLDVPIIWIGNERLAIVAWDKGAEKSGPLYFRITHGRKVADGWKRAVEMKTPSVSVLESGASAKVDMPKTSLMMVNISSGEQKTLARGDIHQLSASADERFIAFLQKSSNTPISSYFAAKTIDDAYDAVNWGTERHVLDVSSGKEVDPSSMTMKPSAPRIPKDAFPVPQAGARFLSAAPGRDAALFLVNDSDGSRLLLAGGGGRPTSSSFEIWRANQWMREIKTGTPELISYKSMDGKELNAWLLLPPNYSPGTRIPLVTIVYPGSVLGMTPPLGFSLFEPNFEHPQLFAALGYGVLRPSMPVDESRSLEQLPNGVLPAIDEVVKRGIADNDRVTVLGQSDGGFAVLGLLTQTTRFRSAIASASFSNFVSLYGTFYGQYRYGDAGATQKSVALRVLQIERGSGGMVAPPWVDPDKYHKSSAIFQANKVTTPLMLVHGDLDFVPIQQAEEFFTALSRQDKRALLVRYQGEFHTINHRSNVLDLWRRINDWLAETASPRK